MQHRVSVRLKPERDRSYSVLIRPGMLDKLPDIIAAEWRGSSVFVITDSTVGLLYGRQLLHDLASRGSDAVLLDFPPGGKSKNADVVFALHTQLLLHAIRRDSLLVALGGGVVGDVAGYVAATVLRGVRYVQVPTTLLAQVDSSVGGKVGVDHPVGKNLIGAFHQPSGVYIDPQVLRTLPAGEFRNGLAEVVKVAAALDRDFFLFLERRAETLTRTNAAMLAEVSAWAVGLKAAVVERDEKESDLRKALNLGHTIGHALEASSGYRLSHGMAVSVGLAAEADIAVRMGLLKPREKDRLTALLRNLGLPTRLPGIRNRSRFIAALGADKKSEQGAARFVLLSSIGHSVIGVHVPHHVLESVLTRR